MIKYVAMSPPFAERLTRARHREPMSAEQFVRRASQRRRIVEEVLEPWVRYIQVAQQVLHDTKQFSGADDSLYKLIHTFWLDFPTGRSQLPSSLVFDTLLKSITYEVRGQEPIVVNGVRAVAKEGDRLRIGVRDENSSTTLVIGQDGYENLHRIFH